MCMCVCGPVAFFPRLVSMMMMMMMTFITQRGESQGKTKKSLLSHGVAERKRLDLGNLKRIEKGVIYAI
jgi:hypothetical protein